MTADHLISCGVFEGFSWIRCEGKGSFLNSPKLKAFGDERLRQGERILVVDLAACTGMDSTFMGTLAGMATRLTAAGNGALQIADAGDRNRRSLEDLGLDYLMQIDPLDAPWRGEADQIREKLKPVEQGKAIDTAQRARHVLQAHELLSGVNEKNAREFENVLGVLKQQVGDKPRGDS